MNATPRSTEYIYETGSDLGGKQIAYLQRLLDPVTTAFLDEIGVEPGQRCLDLGAGGGSITRWLAERTGPAGTVVSVDIDTTRLAEQPGVEVYQHDINDGLPVDGPFDLIHARLLLTHLPRRKEIATMLAGALAPGGWLVFGEFSDRPPHVLSAPGPADATLFERVLETAHDKLAPRVGISMAWAHEAPRHLAHAGLETHAQEYSTTMAGGTTGCLLFSNYARQLDARLRAEGITADELSRFHDLMVDPRFHAWFYQFVQTRGRAR
jgi:SAM-dependent methyltransferase